MSTLQTGHICAHCKQQFQYSYDWENYVYKIDNKFYCCWSCYRKAEKMQEQMTKRKKRSVYEYV